MNRISLVVCASLFLSLKCGLGNEVAILADLRVAVAELNEKRSNLSLNLSVEFSEGEYSINVAECDDLINLVEKTDYQDLIFDEAKAGLHVQELKRALGGNCSFSAYKRDFHLVQTGGNFRVTEFMDPANIDESLRPQIRLNPEGLAEHSWNFIDGMYMVYNPMENVIDIGLLNDPYLVGDVFVHNLEPTTADYSRLFDDIPGRKISFDRDEGGFAIKTEMPSGANETQNFVFKDGIPYAASFLASFPDSETSHQTYFLGYAKPNNDVGVALPHVVFSLVYSKERRTGTFTLRNIKSWEICLDEPNPEIDVPHDVKINNVIPKSE